MCQAFPKNYCILIPTLPHVGRILTPLVGKATSVQRGDGICLRQRCAPPRQRFILWRVGRHILAFFPLWPPDPSKSPLRV